MKKITVLLIEKNYKEDILKILKSKFQKGFCLDFISLYKMIISESKIVFQDKIFKSSLIKSISTTFELDSFIILDVIDAIEFYQKLESIYTIKILSITTSNEKSIKNTLTYKLLNTNDFLNRIKIKNEIKNIQKTLTNSLDNTNVKSISIENLFEYLSADMIINNEVN